MDRRHLLEAQRSHMAAHQGLPTTSFRAPPLPVRSPLSPMIRQQLPQMPQGMPHMFPGRLPHVPPHLTFDSPLSPQLLERQRELKEVSLMQAKLAQQRSMLAYPVASVPHVPDDRVQFVPAIPSNMSPEDSLAQLRRLHQQVLSMPTQEPHFYDMPLPAGIPRDSKEAQEAEFLRLSSKERLLLMEKQLQNAKQLSAREQEGASSHYGSRMTQHHQPFPGRPRSPVGRPSTSRPSPNRSIMFTPSEMMNHELNRSLRENLNTDSGRIIYEMERAKKDLQGQQYLRHDPLLFYQQPQGPCPNAVVIPHEVPSRSHPSLRSANPHVPYYPYMESRVYSRAPSAERKQSPEVPAPRSASTGFHLPQIKSVKSLAPSGEAEKRLVHNIEQKRLLMINVENMIKRELVKDDESRAPLSNSSPDAHTSAIKQVPSIRPATSEVKHKSIGVHSKQLSPSPKDSHRMSPREVGLPQRKRTAPLEDKQERPAKRSRGSGDIFKARLAEYSKSSGGHSGGAVSLSRTSGSATPVGRTAEQPLDLSVSSKPPHSLEKSTGPPKPQKNSDSPSNIPRHAIIRKATTISDIISQAVLASLERPHPREDPVSGNQKAIPDRVTDETSSSSSVPIVEDKRNVHSAEATPVPDGGSRHDLIEHLSTEFAGSFKHFLASLLHECKDKGYAESLALERAGQRIPLMMKEELERCDIKISQTIRALLNDEKEREGSHPSDEARVEKDTSPPCQVTTTTDILQHSSPPCSPSDGKLPSISRDVPKDTETFEVREIPLVSVPDGMGVSMSQSPTAGKTGNEEVECVKSPPPPVMVEPTLLEEVESDVPLCIDEGETCQLDSSAEESGEGLNPPAKDEQIEEDAIDCLIFGNELIDAEPAGTKPAIEDSETEADAEDSDRKPGVEHAGMRLDSGGPGMKLDSGDSPMRSGCEQSEMKEDNKDSGLESDAEAIGNKTDTEESESKPNNDCQKEVCSGYTSVDNEATESKVTPVVSTMNLNSTLHGADVHSENKKDQTSEQAPNSEEGIMCNSEVELDIATENTDPSVIVGVSGINRNDPSLDPVTVGISGSVVSPPDRISPPGNVVWQKELKAITPDVSLGGIASRSVESGVPPTSLKVSTCGNVVPIWHTNPKILLQKPLLPKTLSPTTPPVTTVISHSPITITLPKVYQFTQVPISPPVFQIVSTQNTTNIVSTITAPTVSTLGLSATQPLIVQSKQPVVATLNSPRGIVPTPTTASTSVQLVNPLPTSINSPPKPATPSPPPVTSLRIKGVLESPGTSSPLAQTSKQNPFPANPSKWWMGNELIPNSVAQEQTKKPSVPAYTVVYLAARLPCVVRSSVPFVPPKILWRNLFPQVSFNEFNKALSTCSILQRYMTVMEQAALQKDLASNDISSCKLVPLDEFDKNYPAVRDHLNRTPVKAGRSSGDCFQS